MVVIGREEDEVDRAVMPEDLDSALRVVVEVPADNNVSSATVEHEQPDAAGIMDLDVSERQLDTGVGDRDPVPPRANDLHVLEVERREASEDPAVAAGCDHILDR